jgi:4-amino-4-deoxychorismate lyase
VAARWLVNGRPTGLDPTDRGLAYGDGLFETMALRDGRIRWLEYHLERLQSGCERLQISPLDWDELRREIAVASEEPDRSVVKLIVTRGLGARGYKPPEQVQPTRIVTISSWPEYPPKNYTRGISVRTLTLRLGENPALAGLKHLSRLEQVSAQLELRAGDAEEGLVLDTSGFVVGGITCNVFMVRGSEIATPSLTRCGVRGVMRRAVLESASQATMSAVERDLTLADLEQADEIFMTNALFGIWPVARLDEREIGPGPQTAALMRRLGYGPDA